MIRDVHSKALVETDVAELQKYRKEKKRDKEFQQLRDEIRTLKACINSISEKLNKIESRNG